MVGTIAFRRKSLGEAIIYAGAHGDAMAAGQFST
jgi:hypothetical protein